MWSFTALTLHAACNPHPSSSSFLLLFPRLSNPSLRPDSLFSSCSSFDRHLQGPFIYEKDPFLPCSAPHPCLPPLSSHPPISPSLIVSALSHPFLCTLIHSTHPTEYFSRPVVVRVRLLFLPPPVCLLCGSFEFGFRPPPSLTTRFCYFSSGLPSCLTILITPFKVCPSFLSERHMAWACLQLHI